MPTRPTTAPRFTPARNPVLQHRNNWERVYWESVGRSQRDQSKLGYRTDGAPRVGIRGDDDGGHVIPVGTSRGKSSSRKSLNTDSFRKHLWQSRKLVLAVKQGCSYFHLLQEQEVQEEEQRERRRREERRAIRPPSISSDSDTDGETERRGVGVNAADWAGWRRTRSRRVQSARPFTPIHHSLTSPQLLDLPQEYMYRQLCCLCWLLESLTLEHSGRIGPMTSCWDTKDPGRSRNTLKVLNKEKAIQAKWEQFISSPKSLRPVLRVFGVGSARPPTRLKSSSSGGASSIAVTPSLGSSVSSLALNIKDHGDVTVSGEKGEPQIRSGSEMDSLLPEYLQKLLEEVHRAISTEPHGLEMENRSETNRGDILRFTPLRPDSVVTGKEDTHRFKRSLASSVASLPLKTASSSTPQASTTTTALSNMKAAMLEEMRLAFEERVEELALSLADAVEHSAKKRWSSAVQRYQFLSSVSSYRCHTSSARSRTFIPQVPKFQNTGIPRTTETDKDQPYSTRWLSVLLRALPPQTLLDRKLALVVEKLRQFTAEPILQIRPHIFLRVLNSLQPWELCYPHLCVAIEMVRRYVVGMSEEDYDDWLCGRVHLPQSKLSRIRV